MTDALTANVVFESPGMGRVGPERIGVLDAIDRSGSIMGAARMLGLSYRACWDTVQCLNNLFGEPLIEIIQNTKGAVLTLAGRRLLTDYRDLQREMADVVGRLKLRLGAKAEQVSLAPLVSLRSTARNAWRGTIASIIARAGDAEVTVDLTDGIALTASVSRAALADLDVTEGAGTLVLVQPRAVTLAVPDASPVAGHNHLIGTVIRRDDGATSSEIVLELGAGKTLFAAISREVAGALDLQEGQRLAAFIDPAALILFAT